MPAALAAATVVSATSSIIGGVSANQAAGSEAALQRQEGAIANQQAQTNATNEAFNQNVAVGRQQISFLANGVSLEGSPSIVVNESTKYGQSQVDSILRQGAASKALADAQATQTQNQGRAALLAGIMQGVGSTAKGGYQLYQAGAFDKNTSISDQFSSAVSRSIGGY